MTYMLMTLRFTLNAQNAMRIVEIVYEWSGRKVNRGKTYSTIFGVSLAKPEFVGQWGIKWCTSLEFLGIVFDQILDKMDCN